MFSVSEPAEGLWNQCLTEYSWLVPLIVTITRMGCVSSVLKRTFFWRWWTIIFMARMWSYVKPILWRNNWTFTDWTVLMITFMITYEIRMDCQVTFIALVFFQDCSKYGNIMQHKDVLVSDRLKLSNDFRCNRTSSVIITRIWFFCLQTSTGIY